ncbi:hypothetical protein [Enterococcus hulanensis]|nr:hypothetical protein [Enterococcus hulanensis]
MKFAKIKVNDQKKANPVTGWRDLIVIRWFHPKMKIPKGNESAEI